MKQIGKTSLFEIFVGRAPFCRPVSRKGAVVVLSGENGKGRVSGKKTGRKRVEELLLLFGPQIRQQAHDYLVSISTMTTIATTAIKITINPPIIKKFMNFAPNPFLGVASEDLATPSFFSLIAVLISFSFLLSNYLFT
jgi:hypothetical protein